VNNIEPTAKFIILDFNCSNEFTHHWSSVLSYSSFLNKFGKQVEVWLPRETSDRVVNRISEHAPVIRFLRSPQYSAATITNDTFGYILGRFVQLVFAKKDRSYFKNVIRKLVIKIYTFKILSKLGKEIVKQETVLILPTLDFLSFQIVKYLYREKTEIQIYIRRMGSEQRHPLARGDEFTELLRLLNNRSVENIRLGIPTQALFQELQENCKFPDRIFWSPLPPDIRQNRKRDLDIPKIINIGFPGTARESKGYDLIWKIAEQLKFEEVNFSMFIQQANFPWNGYAASREAIKKTAGSSFIELEPVLSVIDYESLFEIYDVIFLPYRAEEYAEADSGILYQAADWGVPVACFSGLGFSNEAFNYGIGLDLEDAGSLKIMLMKMQSQEMRENIRNYNKVREEAIVNFLKLV
jgi:hypothetical protein